MQQPACNSLAQAARMAPMCSPSQTVCRLQATSVPPLCKPARFRTPVWVCGQLRAAGHVCAPASAET